MSGFLFCRHDPKKKPHIPAVKLPAILLTDEQNAGTKKMEEGDCDVDVNNAGFKIFAKKEGNALNVFVLHRGYTQYDLARNGYCKHNFVYKKTPRGSFN